MESTERMKGFMEALGELESLAAYNQVNDNDSMEEAGASRAKVLAFYQSNTIVQSDDPLIECYRLAMQNKASDSHLSQILGLIAKDKGIRI